MLRIGPMSSRIAQLTVIDILYASVCSKIFDSAKSHLELSGKATRVLHQNPHVAR